VTTAPGQVHTSPDSGLPVTGLLGATRTRDLSASRRTLLQAWCRKVLRTHI